MNIFEDIDPKRFPRICGMARENPKIVEERLAELMKTERAEDALDILESEFGR
mgnify:CR=1 FL=1